MSSHCEKWGYKVEKVNDLIVVFFVSRRKDNKDIENFKERKMAFVSTKPLQDIEKRFSHFVEDGVKGEMSRLYFSVNTRNAEKVKKQLLHFLIDEDFNLEYISGKIAGIAAKKECAKTKHWMFDFDIDDENAVNEFMSDIEKIDNSLSGVIKTDDYITPCCTKWKTPHGYAVIVDHGFDTRELMKKWGENVTLKKDDMLCYTWDWKN